MIKRRNRLLAVLIILTCCLMIIFLPGCDENNPAKESSGVPSFPIGLELEALLDRSIRLTWIDMALSADYFLVERAISSTNLSFMEIALLGAGATEYIDTDLVPGVEYSYRVRAKNSEGYTAYGGPVSIIATGYIDQPELRINDGELGTSTAEVTLTILAHNVSQMLISNFIQFPGAEWEEFRPIVEWDLNNMVDRFADAEFGGIKTVYLRLINTDGDTSEVREDTIYPFPSEFELLINGGEEYVSSQEVNLEIIGAVGAVRMSVSNETGFPDTSDVWWSFENETTWWLGQGVNIKTVRVDIMNDFGLISSDSASVTPLHPTVEMLINDGERYSDSRFVEITLITENDPYQMEIINVIPEGITWKKRFSTGKSEQLDTNNGNKQKITSTQSDSDKNLSELDEDEEWQPFEETFTWELIEGEGTKNIQVRVRNDFLLEATDTAEIEPLSPVNPSLNASPGYMDDHPQVSLGFFCENADSMKIWNTGFEHDEWLPYSMSLGGWELIPLPGGDDNEWLETEINVVFKNSFNLYSDAVSIVVPAKENIPENLVVSSTYDGNGSYQVMVRVSDRTGEPIPDQSRWINFLLSEYSDHLGEVRLNNSTGNELENPYGAPFDSVLTNNGIATVTVDIGDNYGPTELQIWAYQHPELRGTPQADSVLTTYSGIGHETSAPYSIHIDVDERGEDGGGSIWLLEVSAVVLDRNNRPVRDNIVVAFEVSDDIATIGGEVPPYTGNLNREGSSDIGIAYTTLAYNSSATNDTVHIYASVLGAGGELIRGELLDFNLPLQGGGAILYADPANWDYSWGDPALNHITIYVYDGHDHCVNDQLVRLLTTKGQYYAQNLGGAPCNEKVTGPGNVGPPDQDDCGWAGHYLRTTFDEAFPDPNILETTIEVSAEIVGVPHIEVEPLIIHVQQ